MHPSCAGRAAFPVAADEWRILTAAALVGLGDAALRLGVQYAKDRHAFGAPIGSFQAIAHPLVDAATGIEGARRLVHRAAWFADHEPEAIGGGASSASCTPRSRRNAPRPWRCTPRVGSGSRWSPTSSSTSAAPRAGRW